MSWTLTTSDYQSSTYTSSANTTSTTTASAWMRTTDEQPWQQVIWDPTTTRINIDGEEIKRIPIKEKTQDEISEEELNTLLDKALGNDT